jgi:hypothetical protein
MCIRRFVVSGFQPHAALDAPEINPTDKPHNNATAPYFAADEHVA